MFYDLFCKLCSEKSISPTKASLEIGLSKSTATKWKNTGATPSGDTLNKIANYFNVSVDYLLGKEQKERASSLDEKKPEDITLDDFTYAFLDESKELTEENKQKLLEMAKFFKMQQDKEKKLED